MNNLANLHENYLVLEPKTGLIEYPVPESPTSRNQKYRLTVRGEFAVGEK